jgi:hypothetical protein
MSAEALLQQLEWTVLRRLDGLLQGDHKTLFRGSGLELADLRLVIPMRGLAQSLNLSVFAGIALHALSERMRSQPGWGLTAAEQAELVRRWSGSPA